MPENTGMTAVLVNPATQVGVDLVPADLSPEARAKLEQLNRLREELEAIGIKTTPARSTAKAEDPTKYIQLITTPQEAYRLIDEAFADPSGAVIGIFPETTTHQRYAGLVREVMTTGRRAWRFAVHYPFKSAKSGKIRNEGCKLMFANAEMAAELGIQLGDMVALSYISYPQEQELTE